VDVLKETPVTLLRPLPPLIQRPNPIILSASVLEQAWRED
jgi:hypothetical protein